MAKRAKSTSATIRDHIPFAIVIPRGRGDVEIRYLLGAGGSIKFPKRLLKVLAAGLAVSL